MGNGPGKAEALEVLIQTHAINFVKLEQVDSNHEIALTPLGLAIKGSKKCDTDIAAMERFLQNGADANGTAALYATWRDDKIEYFPLRTALAVAVEAGSKDAVEMLLKYGAEIDGSPAPPPTHHAHSTPTRRSNRQRRHG